MCVYFRESQGERETSGGGRGLAHSAPPGSNHNLSVRPHGEWNSPPFGVLGGMTLQPTGPHRPGRRVSFVCTRLVGTRSSSLKVGAPAVHPGPARSPYTASPCLPDPLASGPLASRGKTFRTSLSRSLPLQWRWRCRMALGPGCSGKEETTILPLDPNSFSY